MNVCDSLSLDVDKKCSGTTNILKSYNWLFGGTHFLKIVINISYYIQLSWVGQSLTTSIFCLKSMDGFFVIKSQAILCCQWLISMRNPNVKGLLEYLDIEKNVQTAFCMAVLFFHSLHFSIPNIHWQNRST